jgi:hypothetical protein
MYNEELHDLYFSPNIIRMIKSRMMRGAVYVARIGDRAMHTNFWSENRK